MLKFKVLLGSDTNFFLFVSFWCGGVTNGFVLLGKRYIICSCACVGFSPVFPLSRALSLSLSCFIN